jgi:hypothetical protein
LYFGCDLEFDKVYLGDFYHAEKVRLKKPRLENYEYGYPKPLSTLE